MPSLSPSWREGGPQLLFVIKLFLLDKIASKIAFFPVYIGLVSFLLFLLFISFSTSSLFILCIILVTINIVILLCVYYNCIFLVKPNKNTLTYTKTSVARIIFRMFTSGGNMKVCQCYLSRIRYYNSLKIA